MMCHFNLSKRKVNPVRNQAMALLYFLTAKPPIWVAYEVVCPALDKSIVFNHYKARTIISYFSTATQGESAMDITFAERHGLPKTVTVIEKGAGYPEIFQTALGELGSVEKVAALLIEAENSKWAYYFARYIEGISSEQMDALCTVITNAKDPLHAYLFAALVRNISQKQVVALCTAVVDAKNGELARYFARYVKGLSQEQIGALRAV